MCDILLSPEEKEAALRGSRNVETLGERSVSVAVCSDRARRTLKKVGAYLFKGLAGFLKKGRADPNGALKLILSDDSIKLHLPSENGEPPEDTIEQIRADIIWNWQMGDRKQAYALLALVSASEVPYLSCAACNIHPSTMFVLETRATEVVKCSGDC